MPTELPSSWYAPPGSQHTLVGGIERRRVEGFSKEAVPGTSVRTSAGGTQEIAGGFLEDVFNPHPRFSLTGALRWDSWRNEERSDSELSPRIAARFELTEGVSLVGSLYRSFRAPTLNELYRSFRVGNVLTLANEDLGAERLVGSEIGAVVFRSRSSLRATLFVMEVERNIANITLSVQPDLITRRRENLGQTRSQGLELDGQWMARPWLRLSGGYLFADSTVREFAANPALEGLRVAQIPRHAASLQLQADRSRASAAIQTRWSSDQFEDDLNAITLDGFTLIDTLFVAQGFPSRRGVPRRGESARHHLRNRSDSDRHRRPGPVRSDRPAGSLNYKRTSDFSSRALCRAKAAWSSSK